LRQLINANSLHQLYRDRLARAFLFNPKRRPGRSDTDLEEYRPRLSQITSLYGPYHLINTALNVPATKTANRRGRNADFFIFSPKFVGSKSTNYVATEDIEEVADSISRPRWRHRAQGRSEHQTADGDVGAAKYPSRLLAAKSLADQEP
jgi:hypothetical protein